MDTKGISNKQIIRGMSKIKLEDNCLLIIRKGSVLAENTDFEQLKTVVTQMGLKNVAIIISDSTADIGKIPERWLNKEGWYQLGEVAKMFQEYKEKHERD